MSLGHDIAASRVTLGLFALMGLLWAGFHAWAPAVKAAAGLTDWQFGVVILASSVGSLAAMLAAPTLERRAGARSLLVAGGVMLAAFQVLPHATGFAGLLGAMVLVGAGMGLTDVLMNAEVSRIETRSGRSLMSLNHGTYSLIYAMAALAAAPARAEGWSLGLWYLVVLAPALILLWQARRVETGPAGETGGEGAGRLPVAVLWGGIVVCLAFACENAVESWSALHVERSLGGSAAEGPLGPASLGLTMAIGRLFGHVLVRRHSEVWLMRRASVLAAAGTLLAAMAPVPWVAYAGFAAAGLGISVLAPLGLALTGRAVSPDLRTRAIARGAGIGYTGFFFGPLLMGLVTEAAGLAAAFLMVTAVLMAVPLLLGRIAGKG